ncbi:MAG TPA: FxsA family protein [Acidimicrobiales bacterium]|nr:FxsA family protein [Acidimicrobiales bacterium]
MFAALALLFLVVPFVELFVLIQVGQVIGPWWTIGALVAVSVAGSWLVKREGLSTLRRAQTDMRQGSVPGTALVDGVLILFAGALLLTPGFLTDLIGLGLLVPPVRLALRTFARKRIARRMNVIEIEAL